MNSEASSSLAGRIRECAVIAGNAESLAQKTAIPRRTLESYLAGETEPKASRLIAIASVADVRPEWLLTGKGPMRVGKVESAPIAAPEPAERLVALDHDFGGEVCAAVLDLYRAEQVRLSTARIMAIALEKYEEITAMADTLEERRAVLKYALAQIRKDLRSGAPATTQGNRSA